MEFWWNNTERRRILGEILYYRHSSFSKYPKRSCRR